MTYTTEMNNGDIRMDADRSSAAQPQHYTSELVGYTGREDGVVYSPDYGWVLVSDSGYYSPIFGMLDSIICPLPE